MLSSHLQRLEGVWTGTENVNDGMRVHHSSGRLVFQTVFDGRFLLCDYVRTAPERPAAFAHGVFRRDDHSKALTVTWFRTPNASNGQQSHAVAEGDETVFYETIDDCTTRTTYVVQMDRLAVYTDSAKGDDWKRIFEGAYRRR